MSTDADAAPRRTGEYRERGDYHRHLDPHWSYAPIYERKLRWTDRVVAALPSGCRLLDVGAGEGVLVERYRERGHDITGVDAAYQSEHVKKASLLSLPFEPSSYDAVFCLDVLEHIDLLQQEAALGEIHRVLKPGGRLFLSLPNLAHLHSRLSFLLRGQLTRTSAVERHPGDRPLREYEGLVTSSGFRIERRDGIFPTLPLAFRWVNRHPARMGFLVGILDHLLPFPGLCFLCTMEASKIAG